MHLKNIVGNENGPFVEPSTRYASPTLKFLQIMSSFAWSPLIRSQVHCWQASRNYITGENLDAVTAVTDSFKMADVSAGDRTGGAVAQTSARTIGVSVWQGWMWMSRLQGMHDSSWWIVIRAKSAIVDPRDAAVTARGWCSISFVKPNNDPVTTKSPTQRQYLT